MNNFDILVGPRGCGVSTRIAKEAVKNDGIIIVPTSATKREMVYKVCDILASTLEEHHIDVFTIREFTDRQRGRGIDYTRPIYVDDFDKCFAELFATCNIGNKVVCYGTTMEGFDYEQL